ncbi:3-methyl-2-oxobutanoate hydroxymethyltransferase [Aliidiomarina shirensis]|uniref:3-methyl-2-oxobutanoate hydroxymethyltransferase n=1 Tax=Aliidiomarina shirensis TaxID=1048642 RepID=A0A432WR12_9GAMM|nr:3-methyl-2-oxobutanoate hydroxymethyltransferase [Aliidiomarina shirensis]RUO36210.1 3-methyl-2-oxobutanoate hydroxymethyltransferase [Aliidiomarina shirensis]
MSRIRTAGLLKMKQEGKKITALTAYDSSFAKLFATCGIDVMLVGDSLGMVLQGLDSTVPVTTAEVAYHTRCVRAGAPDAFVIADMAFMTYPDPSTACFEAAELMRAGANMVKLEGGEWLVETVQALTRQGIPVCAHLGLLPQSVNVVGGYKVQGRDEDSAAALVNQARALQAAGAQLLVVECIPSSLGEAVAKAIDIPVIGIGAGNKTDGQILVMHDMLGMNADYLPKFTKNFLAGRDSLTAAVEAYVDEVRSGAFPGPEHSFNS